MINPTHTIIDVTIALRLDLCAAALSVGTTYRERIKIVTGSGFNPG